MRVLAARLRPRLGAGVLAAAQWVGAGVRSVPGAGGALLVFYGAWQVYAPAGAIVAGAFLLALDRKLR